MILSASLIEMVTEFSRVRDADEHRKHATVMTANMMGVSFGSALSALFFMPHKISWLLCTFSLSCCQLLFDTTKSVDRKNR